MGVLVTAWHAIRRNSETSQQKATKQKARTFGENLPANLRRIQDRLRNGYRFSKAYGATPPKGGGKTGKRPIVVAPLEDRIVQRAILDVLQDAVESPGVQRVLRTVTSVGGIRGRGVDHAIALFEERVREGDRYVAGSDISGFFTKIQRKSVVDFLNRDLVESNFVRLVDDALTVELSNVFNLSEDDRKLFPTGEDGVAQGCPLSALAGNIVLENFDLEMNKRGITCIRYIDDFIVIGKKLSSVRKAMEGAKSILSRLNMDIYDPKKSPNKAFIGSIGEPHVFLGYKLIPGVYPPGDVACDRLMAQIGQLISDGKRSIHGAVSGRILANQDRCYAQTLVAVDRVIHGWRASFRSSNCPNFFERIDQEIDRCLLDFRSFFSSKMTGKTATQQRRATHVQMLSDWPVSKKHSSDF
jgi:retron-type reverse transcriptase